MRLTTKIVLGVIGSIFLLSFGVIIFISSLREGSSYFSEQKISQENMITVYIEPYKTILIDEEIKGRNLYPIGTVHFQPVNNESENSKLFLPEDLLQFTNIISSNDTLIILLKSDELYKKYITAEEKPNRHCALGGVNYFFHSNQIDIINNISGINVDIRNIKIDKININTYSEIFIDSCQANVIDYGNIKARKFNLKNSQIKELYIDLDNIGYSWQVENCEIEVENLTGSGKHNIKLNESRVKIMNWIPENKEAQLTVTLLGDTAKIVFP